MTLTLTAGKLLTVFGERDENVDCMNRIKDPLAPPKQRGLDGLEVELGLKGRVRARLKLASRAHSSETQCVQARTATRRT